MLWKVLRDRCWNMGPQVMFQWYLLSSEYVFLRSVLTAVNIAVKSGVSILQRSSNNAGKLLGQSGGPRHPSQV
jgi:hypothetical protein